MYRNIVGFGLRYGTNKEKNTNLWEGLDDWQRRAMAYERKKRKKLTSLQNCFDFPSQGSFPFTGLFTRILFLLFSYFIPYRMTPSVTHNRVIKVHYLFIIIANSP